MPNVWNRFVSLIKHNSLAQLFSSKVFVEVTTVLQSIIISRLLGPQGKGEFAEVVMWPTLIASFVMMGLYTGVVRISAKPNLCSRYNVTMSVLLSTAIPGFVGVLIALGVNSFYFANREVLMVAKIYAIYVVICNCTRVLLAVNAGKGNLRMYSIASAILNPIYFLCLLILFLSGKVTVSTALLALLFANFCSFLFRYLTREKEREHKIMSPRKILGYCVRFLPSDLSEPLYSWYDKAVIAFILSPYDLGLYTIAYSSAGLINIVSSTFNVKLFSDVARGDTSNLFNFVRLNFVVMIASALCMSCLLPFLIPLVFGRDFAPAIVPSLILLVVCILQGQSVIIEKSILAKGYPFVGIKAKAIAIAMFAAFAVVFYMLGISSLVTLALLLILVQFVYLEYLRRQMGKIFKDNRIVPNAGELKSYALRIASVIRRRG